MIMRKAYRSRKLTLLSIESSFSLNSHQIKRSTRSEFDSMDDISNIAETGPAVYPTTCQIQ